jgi:TatD family-associated radical SAM protein
MQQIAYPIGNRLYLNITDRCTLVCRFCPKNTDQGPRVHDYDLSLDHRPEVEEIIAALDDPAQWEEVVFCGFGEPTLRLKVLKQVAAWIKERGGRVRVNTDGLGNLVNKRNILPELQGLVDSLSVSLNAQNPEVYDRHCQPQLKGSWQAVLDFLRQAPQYIPRVTATAIDGLEGVDIEACAALARELGVDFRRRELDKVG